MSAAPKEAPTPDALDLTPPFDNPQPRKEIDGKVRARQLRDQALRELLESGVVS